MPTQTTPPEIAGFSTPIHCFGSAAAGIREALTWATGATIVGLGFLIAGIVISRQPGKEDAWWIFGTVACAIALLVSLFFWSGLLWLKSRRIWLYPEGVVDSSRGKHQTYFWSDVDEISYWSMISDLAMRTAEGKQIDFGSATIDRAGQLAQSVVENVVPIMALRLAKQLQTGETVSFGRIEANKSGLAIHYKARKSSKRHSFYRGPWPRCERLMLMAKGHQKDVLEVPWTAIVRLEENNECDLTLITSSESIPLYCWPCDVPNSIVLPAIAKLMR